MHEAGPKFTEWNCVTSKFDEPLRQCHDAPRSHSPGIHLGRPLPGPGPNDPLRFRAVSTPSRPFFKNPKRYVDFYLYPLFTFYYYITLGAIRILKIGIYIAPAPAPLRAGRHLHQHPYVCRSFGMEIEYGFFNLCRTDYCACDAILLGSVGAQNPLRRWVLCSGV